MVKFCKTVFTKITNCYIIVSQNDFTFGGETMHRYSIVEEKFNDELGNYTTYGIEIFDENCQIGKICDVSLNKAAVIDFCNKLNNLSVSAGDLPELLEDFFSQI